MRRYQFLQEEDIYAALNRLRDAFLAAKDGRDVEEIINGLLTQDEKLKIGRRILIAEYLDAGVKIEEIARELKVGKNTIVLVMKSLDEYQLFLPLIMQRTQRVKNEYQKNSYKKTGGSTQIYKRKSYTRYTRKDVKR